MRAGGRIDQIGTKIQPDREPELAARRWKGGLIGRSLGAVPLAGRRVRALGTEMLPRMMAISSASLALLGSTYLGAAQAATPYDGNWSVVIITQRGDCDKAYRYAVRVEDGTVKYGGDGSFDIRGKVGSGGQVQAKISRGDQSATATGRLSAKTGAGTWTGKSPQKQCGGRWEAERR